MKCPFLYHKPPPKLFLWITSASQPWTMCNYASPEPPHQHFHLQDHLRKAAWMTATTISLYNQKFSCTVSGDLMHMLSIGVWVWIWMKFFIVTNLSGQMVAFDGIWNFGEVFSSRMTWLYRADSMGEWLAYVSIVDRVVGFWWMRYGHTPVQVPFIWMQRYSDSIQRPIVVPFIHNHHLTLQPSPNYAHLYTISRPGKHPGSCMSHRHTGHVSDWACLGRSRSTYTSMSSSFWHSPATSHSCFKGPKIHRPQSTTQSTLCVIGFLTLDPRGVFHCGLLEAHLFAH